MKKEYLKPEMLVEEILLEIETMLVSSGPSVGTGGDDETLGTNEHRGVWGNLWN